MKRERPLDAFPLVRTQSIDELRSGLGHIIAEPVLEPVGRDRQLDAVQNHCRLRQIGANYGSYGMAVRFQFPEPTVFSQIYPLKGRAQVLVDETLAEISPDNSVAVSADASTFNMVSDAEYERLILLIDPGALNSKLGAMLGQVIQSPVRVDPVQDMSQPAARALRSNFMFLVDQLDAGRRIPPLVQAEIEQMLVVLFLQANRHNYSHLLEREPRDAAHAQVRRAEDYIQANLHRAIALEELAEAAGVSVLSLFRSFRKVRRCSPLEFAARLRAGRPDLS